MPLFWGEKLVEGDTVWCLGRKSQPGGAAWRAEIKQQRLFYKAVVLAAAPGSSSLAEWEQGLQGWTPGPEGTSGGDVRAGSF